MCAQQWPPTSAEAIPEEAQPALAAAQTPLPEEPPANLGRPQHRRRRRHVPAPTLPLSAGWQLPPWNHNRFGFFGVLRPAPRSGGQIELHQDYSAGTLIAVKRTPAESVLSSPEVWRRTFPTEPENPWQEVAMLMRHGRPGPHQLPGVCSCEGAFFDKNGDLMLACEYLAGGDLFDYVDNMGAPGLEREQTAWRFVRSLLGSVFALHDAGVSHGDVSLENLLLRIGPSGDDVVLIDFGMAVTQRDRSMVCGKPSYQAPEMHTSPTFDAHSSDLFACGVVAYALAVGGYPWNNTKPGCCSAFQYAQRHGLLAYFGKRKVGRGSGQRQTVVECLSPQYLKLLLVLLDFEPSRRTGVSSILDQGPEDFWIMPQTMLGA